MGQTQTKTGITEADAERLRKFYDNELENRLVAENLNFAQRRAIDKIERQDQLAWEVLAAATTTIVLLAAGSIYKRKDLIIPIVPLIMSAGYRYDVAKGGNLETVQKDAENLLKTTNFELVGGPITLKNVDEFRRLHFQ